MPDFFDKYIFDKESKSSNTQSLVLILMMITDILCAIFAKLRLLLMW